MIKGKCYRNRDGISKLVTAQASKHFTSIGYINTNAVNPTSAYWEEPVVDLSRGVITERARGVRHG